MKFTRKKMLEVLNNAKDAFENALKNESMIVQTSVYENNLAGPFSLSMIKMSRMSYQWSVISNQ